MYCGYLTTIKNLRKHPNADALQLGECFGNTVCVNLDYAEGEIGVYFPCDGQLSVEFCEQNNLIRKKDENGKKIGGYMDPDKRNVKAIHLRGEKSDGLFLPMSCLVYTGINFDDLNIGDPITVVNGHEICQKYIPLRTIRTGQYFEGNRTRKHKVDTAPLFAEHADTEQLAYNLGAFKSGDEIEITLKMHGTSQRTGYLPVFKEYKKDFWGRVLTCVKPKSKFAKKLIAKAENLATSIYDWGYVTGTRRVVLDDYDGGFYGSNAFREKHSKVFEGKLMKGETVYYEVVGFTNTGDPIMSSESNLKLKNEEFVKIYGEKTVFSYGCSPICEPDIEAQEDENGYLPHLPQSDIYVYRMTMTNEDGFVVEYTPDFMRYRCEQMGVKTVPVFARVILPSEEYFDASHPVGEYVKAMAEQFYDGPDPIGKTHIREGVVVRIINRSKFCAYKHKNHDFKVLEGLIKEEAVEPDMEEIQEVEKT